MRPRLTQETEIVWWCYQQVSGGVTDGWGAPNLAAIDQGLRLAGVPRKWRAWAARQLIEFLILLRPEEDTTLRRGNG